MFEEKKYPLKLVSSMVSIITFTADLITVGLFIRSIFLGELSLPSAVSQILVIITVFAFATLLWFYSKDDAPTPDLIFSLFSWLYIVFSAAIFVIISHTFMIQRQYSLGEYIGYILLVFFIGGLGFFTYAFNEKRVDYFAIPYMLVALSQIVMWVFIIFSEQFLEFNWITVGNIGLFIIAGMIVLFLIDNQKGAKPLLILLTVLGISGYIALGLTVVPLRYMVLWVVPLPLIIWPGKKFVKWLESKHKFR